MASFNIIQSDPEEYKEKILEFWEAYLPGTPPGRYEWMLENPAGPAIWFFAFEESKNELVGTISIMPRDMLLHGKSIKAGIVGDFMVSTDYRVFGPALTLQKVVLEAMSDHGFNYVYTVPNQASLKMNQRAGYVNAVKLVHYVKPVRISQYLKKFLNDKLSIFIGAVLDFCLRMFSKESYVFFGGYFDERKSADASFDVIWDEVKKLQADLIGDHSAEYINWKYFNNPVSEFRLITLRSKKDEALLGYIIFSVVDGKLEIYDILALKQSYKNKLLKRVIQVARREKCQAVYIRMLENSSDLKNVRGFLFFDAKNDISVLAFGEDVSVFRHWAFTEGDRNS